MLMEMQGSSLQSGLYSPGDWLRAQAAISPRRLAFVDNRKVGQEFPSWDYCTLDQGVDEWVESLMAAGVQPGDRVAMLLPPVPAAVFLIHALARRGAILVPLNVRLTLGEIEFQLMEARCAFLVCDSKGLATLNASALCQRIAGVQPEKLSLEQAGVKDEVLIVRLMPPGNAPDGLAELFGVQYDPWDLRRVQAIIFTSGTTGRPKGALLTFGNHFWSAVASSYRIGIDPQDCWLLTLPVSHVGGLAIILRSCLYGTAFVLQEHFDPQAILGAISEHQASMLSLVPTMLHRLLELRGSAPVLASLRCILLGGAAAPQALVERALQAGLNLALTYGMTETASQIATAAPAEVRQKFAQGRTMGSVGKPLLFCKVKILDDAFRELPSGQAGQIAVEGPMVMPGYLSSFKGKEPVDLSRNAMPGRDAYLNQQSFIANGAFLTGDMGCIDEQGDLWVLQRRSDLILSGGENVYPSEVEQVLRQHPDVVEACVVGVEDPEWGQRVVAAIVLRKAAMITVEEILTFCRTSLAGYKIPRQVFFLETLPQTHSGKVSRSQVVELIKTLQNQSAAK